MRELCRFNFVEKLQSETAEIVPPAKSKAVRRKRFAPGAVEGNKSRQANKEVTAEIVPAAKSKAVSGTLDVAVARPDPPKSGKAVFSQADADYFRSILAPGGEKLPGAFSKRNIQLLIKNDPKFKEILDRHVQRRMLSEENQVSEKAARKKILHIMKNNVASYRDSLKKKQTPQKKKPNCKK